MKTSKSSHGDTVGMGDAPQPFSEELHGWLKSDQRKTLSNLNEVFGEKTFAIAFILLMALPALPIPTGGVTHVTELITMLLTLEMIAGRRSVWLPRRWLGTDVGKVLKGRAVTKLIAFIAWFERFSRRRGAGLLTRRPVLMAVGLIILIFTLAAFVAPPFSGLDTLPALGVVIISLALVLEDALVLLAGMLIGALGIGLDLAAGSALYSGFRHFF